VRVTDFLGDQEVVLHEAFDVLHAGMRRYNPAVLRYRAGCRMTNALPDGRVRKCRLQAHRPQEIGAAAKVRYS